MRVIKPLGFAVAMIGLLGPIAPATAHPMAGEPDGIDPDVAEDPDRDGLYEDVNGDGNVTFEDATLLPFLDFENATNRTVKAFDFDGDGEFTIHDAVWLRYEVGDVDNDGLTEDIDADGDVDFHDAVELAFDHDGPPEWLDFDNDGDVDFDDAIALAFDEAL